ncbi:MAG TPA: zinc ribbon domain-containing protein, partial [Solirubrobacteraceae bacterium]
MTCPACAAENREGARFCDTCGAALAAACPSCGAEPRPGAGFCDRCGTALAPAAADVAGPVPAPGPGPGELRVVSVLFVDLVGFTALSESRDAEEVRELLGRYFDTARTIVGRYGG